MADEKNDLGVFEFTEGIRERVGENSGLDAVIKFAFDEGGVIFIDGQSFGGYDDIRRLDAAGELDGVLGYRELRW